MRTRTMSVDIGTDSKGRKFTLPIELTTQTLAILAKRGVGKTYLASVIAENLLESHQQVIAIDPTGAWWGLKSSADGNSDGFPVVVFGGDNADLPLEESSGEIVARALVEKRFSAVLDLSHMRKNEMYLFLTTFLETLYRLNREPVHLVCDEADAYAPQRVSPETARVLGAMEDLVRRGRRKGIGATLVSQRPAALNKGVLTQCEMLVAMRLIHPRDIAPIHEWVAVHADEKNARVIVDSLPSLPVGTAWFWSPGWGDVFSRVQVRSRTTFDSSATPKPGERLRVPKKLAQVDVNLLGIEIAKAADAARENSPTFLRSEIIRLKTELGKTKVVPIPPREIIKEVPVIPARATQLAGELRKFGSDLMRIADALLSELSKKPDAHQTAPATNLPQRVTHPAPQPTPIMPKADPGSPRTGKLSRAERSVLIALAQHGASSKARLAALSGYAVNGGGFNNALSALRTLGFIDGREPISATEAGLEALGPFEPLPTGRELLDQWLGRLDKAQKAILTVLTQHYPTAVSYGKEELAAQAGYDPSGGGFNNALSRLRTLELITRGREIRVSENLILG